MSSIRMPPYPKTVLFVSHDASRTGAPILLLRFLQWFRNHLQIPFRILVVNPGELLPEFELVGRTDVLERDSRLRRAFRRFNLPVWDSSRHLELLGKELLRSNIGLIYSNTMATGRALDYLSFLDCPVVCHVHELEQAIRDCDRGDNLNLVKRHASSYIAVSRAAQMNLVVRHGIPKEKIKVIYGFIPAGGIVWNKRGDPRLRVRRELRIPRDAKLVCACGSIAPRKGPDLFLRIANTLAKAHAGLSAHFVWIGGGKEQVRAMRKQAKKFSCQDVVHFLGSRPDVGPYYEAADVFLLPSREDPFPLVMLEAALHGKPVVCFDDSGGAPEFVQQDAGFVVPGFDISEMAAKVALLLTSDVLRRNMGEAGRQRVLRQHDIDVAAPRIAAIIQCALTSPEKLDVALHTP